MNTAKFYIFDKINKSKYQAVNPETGNVEKVSFTAPPKMGSEVIEVEFAKFASGNTATLKGEQLEVISRS